MIDKNFIRKLKEIYFLISFKLHQSKLLKLVLIIGISILLNDSQASAFEGKKYDEVCGKVLGLLRGGFGGLLMACAGVGAVVASATGGFRLAWSLVVVAVGAFTLKEYQEIWTTSCSEGEAYK
jgi:type IV secretory pathway VirB2 component (pilin)